MEEVQTYHRNLAVAFYAYKKAYDKVHHDKMLIIYKWIEIQRNVITLLSLLVRNGKKTGNLDTLSKHSSGHAILHRRLTKFKVFSGEIYI